MSAAGAANAGPDDTSGLIDVGEEGLGNGAGVAGDVRAAHALAAAAITMTRLIREAPDTIDMRRFIGSSEWARQPSL